MPAGEPRYDVGGVRLGQPFKARRPGHFALNARNAAALADFYRRILGMKVSDVVNYRELPETGRTPPRRGGPARIFPPLRERSPRAGALRS